jgi:hypothetical protein
VCEEIFMSHLEMLEDLLLGCAEEISEGEYQARYADYNDDGDDVDDGIDADMAAASGPRSLFEKPGYWRTRDRCVFEISKMELARREP